MHYSYWAFRGWEPIYWGWMGLQLLAWVLVLLGLFWLYKRYRNTSPMAAGVPTALDILKKRYAKGEISQEEFNTMKEHIK